MGSTAGLEQDEITVLVTGFGPFKEQYPLNPSWEIASRLPAYLPPERAKTAHTPSSSYASPIPPVRILPYPHPIRVNYQTIRALLPTLWDPADTPIPEARGRRIDYVVHMGMAGPALHYAIERKGHRDGYKMPDVDKNLLGDDERREREGKDWIWYGCPPELETDLALDDVLRRWKGHAPDNSDLRISNDAGHYACDFIYYSSLSLLWKANEHRRVVFLHVPASSSDSQIATGRELTLQLIRSIVESEQSMGKKPTPR